MAFIWEIYVKPNTLTDLKATVYKSDGTVRIEYTDWEVIDDYLYHTVKGSSGDHILFTATGYQDLDWGEHNDGQYIVEMEPIQYIKEIKNGDTLYFIKDAEAREDISTLNSRIVTNLTGLSDVSISSPSQGENLTYDAVTGKWKNTATSATVAWGGITGDISDQTDLKNALNTRTTKFSVTNPYLSSSNGKCTWSITNTIGSKKVQVAIYSIDTNEKVVGDITATDSTILVELISSSSIRADSYEAVVIG